MPRSPVTGISSPAAASSPDGRQFSYPLSAMPASRRITSTHSSTPARLVSMTLSAGYGGS